MNKITTLIPRDELPEPPAPEEDRYQLLRIDRETSMISPIQTHSRPQALISLARGMDPKAEVYLEAQRVNPQSKIIFIIVSL